MANNVDPDQMQHYLASDLGLLPRLSIPILRVYKVLLFFFVFFSFLHCFENIYLIFPET